MKIAFTPNFRQTITENKYQQFQNTQYISSNNDIQPESQHRKIFAYQDFNINFTGRTPEDFYAQDFNRNNMPRTMKSYLDYDYEQRQHIPPEQMLQEAFKYLNYAKDFNEVKELYPDEELFENLHPMSKNVKKGILSEIKVARELGNNPLLKDGSDDFGMYLLKKIYTEGKTLKEINKDFLEKDINEEYKGIVTEPIDYSTTSAYGIKFPNSAFWHSFISTREEYKTFFVTLPKNNVNPGVNLKHVKSNPNSVSVNKKQETQHKPRKYTIQKFRKEQLTKDIKDSDMSGQDIERKIRRRFTKDDPEASFIVKYLSPIMTVAAARIHLSEELKGFSQSEKNNGKKGDDLHMLKRFWKNNPSLKHDYAKAITDTIELFEDNYGAGGLIPINNEFQPITSKTDNQKAIDYVTPNFIDFIDKIKELEIERTKRYLLHDELQPQWEEHLNNRYSTNTQKEIDDDLEDELAGVKALHPEFSPEDALKDIAKEYNAQVIELKGKNGEKILLAGNIEELYQEKLAKEAELYPTAYAKQYIKDLTKNPEITDKYKLTLATQQIKDKIDDEKIMNEEEYVDTTATIHCLYYINHADQAMAASAAMADVINKELGGSIPVTIYKLYPHEFNYLINSNNEEINQKIKNILLRNKKELDNLYNLYNKPISASEKNKIEITLLDQLSKYNGSGEVTTNDTREILLMLKEMTNSIKFKRKFFREALGCLVPEYKFTRCILDKTLDNEHKTARFEQIMNLIIRDFLSDNIEAPIVVSLLNREIIDKHKANLSDNTYVKLMMQAQRLEPKDRRIFEYTNSELQELDRIYRTK